MAVHYWIAEEVVGWWFWKRKRYWVETEVSRIGPYDSIANAELAATPLRWR